MIFTYLIHYEEIDDFDEIEFCAETRNEAIDLFNEWCVLDNDMDEPKKMISIELLDLLGRYGFNAQLGDCL